MSVGEWAQQLFLVQLWDDEFLDGASWVGATWSISAEWLAYLLFPVAALVFFRLRNLPLVVLGVGATALMLPIASAYATVGHPYHEWSWLTRILCGFAAGVLVHLVVTRIPRTELVGRVASPDGVCRRRPPALPPMMRVMVRWPAGCGIHRLAGGS